MASQGRSRSRILELLEDMAAYMTPHNDILDIGVNSKGSEDTSEIIKKYRF